MNTALVLSHLIVVAMLPVSVCDTDTSCEQAARDFGCTSYVAESPDDDDNGPVFVCDRATFERKLKAISK